MKRLLNYYWILLIFLSLFACFATRWTLITYDDASFEQILFHITEPITGVESALIDSFFKNCVLITCILSFIFVIGIILLMASFKNNKLNRIVKRIINILTIFIVVICLYLLGFFEYLIVGNTESKFIEENFVDPQRVKITFPDAKRNLIYIYAESLESSYISIEDGGLQEINLIPELTMLAKDNISFSDTDKLGGAYQLNGTSWTTAAMVAHTAGIPLKMGREIINFLNVPSFMDGAYTIGEILKENGYNQTIMFGSDGNFGNRQAYFSNHGNYYVYDYYSAISKGIIDDDYMVFWGFEDSKLFEFAKEEALSLYNKNKPFNLSILTVNTHSPEGYLEDSCPKIYDNQYKNVIACSSIQIYEFIKWCKEQDFYKDTTIVITGDHLSMSNELFNKYDTDDRRIFNTFINSGMEPIKTNNREFSTMDMFPTTLASLGVTIEGNRLGLGTNLFSEEKTLLEKYGFDKVNKEISYKSDFYNNKFLLLDK